jgi:ABC-type antimicrobial peptide transport system permease subunit
MDKQTKEFISIVGIIVSLGMLLLGILTSSATEALKYFAVTIVFLALLVAYIQVVIVKRIEELEKGKGEK